MTSSYFSGASGCVVVFDVTSKESLENVHRWVGEAKQFADKTTPFPFFIIGNKIDEREKRNCTRQDGQFIAQKANALYFEVSAKTKQWYQRRVLFFFFFFFFFLTV
eukprot:TRINITY_DN4161_c0_g1_i11.p4 TRINITY_DN4161_c0_g1~~TRINITY_DN4161_c0_g1_i11.p4  ORF type:complete len:106 (-),score=25.23 TRINITY_DN4161_c0_g1_i11:755-1072(-)